MSTATTDNDIDNDKDNDGMITIDGRQGEGGGQILRNSVAYASLLNKPLTIHSIRAKRRTPGLQAQHVAAIGLAAELGGGVLEGAMLQSTEITYVPPTSLVEHGSAAKKAKQGEKDTTTDTSKEETRTVMGIVQTAGSICLLLQAALPCALLGSTSTKTTKLVLKGGTNASMAPQYDYWERIFLPTLQQWIPAATDGIQSTMITRGYFPKGGGHVEILVPSLRDSNQLPLPLPPLQLTDRGTVQHIYIRSFHAGKLPKYLATQMGQAAKKHLEEQLLTSTNDSNTPTIDLEIVTEPHAVGSGLGILIVATTTTNCRLGGSALCNPKQKAHEAGRQAAQELLDTLLDGGCVDEWMQDQLILWMALASGTSTVLTGSLSLHTQTAIQVAQQMVPGVNIHVKRVEEESGEDDKATAPNKTNSGDYGQAGRIPGKHLITCHGIGYTGL